MFFSYGTLSTQGGLLTEILTSVGYSLDDATIFGAIILASGLFLSIAYSVFFINYKNQMYIMCFVIFIEVIAYSFIYIVIYFEWNKYFTLSSGIVFAIGGFTIVPVITEEVIKICSIIGPERMVYATG